MSIPRNQAANHAVEWINNLTLTGDFSGQPFTLRPWQENKIIRPLFGTLGKDGKRAINTSVWLLCRKQGKSQLAAGVLLYALCNFPPGQQIYSVGRDRAQASEIFNLAKQMCEQDPELMQIYGIEIIDSQKRIVIPSRHSFYAALSKEHKGSKLGKNPSLILIDEAQNADHNIVSALTTGQASRINNPPLTIWIMTGGDRKDGIGYEVSEHAKKLESGVVTDSSWHTALWYAKEEEEDQWDQPSLWKRVIPALGDFVSETFYKNEAIKAHHLPRLQSDFKKFYLNLWQSPNSSWLHDSDWMKNDAEPLGCDEFILGLDLASVNDTSSAVLFGKNKEGTFDVIPFIWVCQRQILECTEVQASYPIWAKQGFLRVTPGDCQDQERILADLIDICGTYNVTKIGLDRWGTQYFGPKILDELPEVDIQAVSQGMRDISEPLKQIERLCLGKQLRHGGHPVMRFQCSNARIIRDHSQNIRLDKRNGETMDSMQALAMAVARFDFSGLIESSKKSVYENRGMFIL
jgi:phage terminase large subunit-like protein